VEVYFNLFVASAVEEVIGDLHVPVFLLLAKVPAARWVESWMIPKAASVGFGEQKMSCLNQDSNPRKPSPYPSRFIEFAHRGGIYNQ
jgi:hypothetical protein